MSQDQLIEDLADRVQKMQITARAIAQKRDRNMPLRRGFHAKGTGVRAKFQINSDIPNRLQVGLFQPGVSYDALVRFSNARGEVLGDLSKDQRGVAIRLTTKVGKTLAPDDIADIQDFLMTNTPISFARNPLQFIEVGEILLGGIGNVIPRLVRKYGFKEARRILGVFLAPIISFKPLQMNQYWSRTSYQFGQFAVRYLIRPSAGSATWSTSRQLTEVLRSLRQDAAQREHYFRGKLFDALKHDELQFDFCVQLFVDEKKTPIEDAYVEWKESDSPPVAIARLLIPKQDFDPHLQEQMEVMAFNPWNTRDITPLGLINLARKKVYNASALRRGVSAQSIDR